MPLTGRQEAMYRSLSALSEEQENALRERYNSGEVSYRALAVEFDVSLTTVHRVLRRAHARAYRRALTPPKSEEERIRTLRLQRVYGITVEAYDRLYDAQAGCCASCQEPIERRGKFTNIDHCHETHAVRGLLCTGCNTALGSLAENPERIRGLLRYAEDVCASFCGLEELGL